MILTSEHFNGRFEKIAQSVMNLNSGNSIKNNLSNNDSGSRLNVSNTISKVREKGDVQPLHKDTRIIDVPRDQPHAIKMTRKQNYLSDIEDKRITYNHLRSK